MDHRAARRIPRRLKTCFGEGEPLRLPAIGSTLAMQVESCRLRGTVVRRAVQSRPDGQGLVAIILLDAWASR
jgi:hypothetical protein